jgi:hypothetical protein
MQKKTPVLLAMKNMCRTQKQRKSSLQNITQKKKKKKKIKKIGPFFLFFFYFFFFFFLIKQNKNAFYISITIHHHDTFHPLYSNKGKIINLFGYKMITYSVG